MTETNLHETSALGLQADGVLNNPAFIEGFERLRGSIVEQWAGCNARDVEEMQNLLMMHKCADAFEAHLRSMVAAGTMADADLKRQIEQADAEAARLRAEKDGLLSRGMRNVQRLARRA